jgi:putative FmdB family regulatory protein
MDCWPFDDMPLYEYQCNSCGARMERIQKFSDPPLQECPTCGGALTKLISSPAIQFKGSGWYITDYARNSGTKEGRGSKDETSSKDTESSSKDASGSASTAAESSSSSEKSAEKAPAATAPAKPAKD